MSGEAQSCLDETYYENSEIDPPLAFNIDIDNTDKETFGDPKDGLFTLQDAVAFAEGRGLRPLAIARTHPGGFNFVFWADWSFRDKQARFLFACHMFGVDALSTDARERLRALRVDLQVLDADITTQMCRVPGSVHHGSKTVVQGWYHQDPKVHTLDEVKLALGLEEVLFKPKPDKGKRLNPQAAPLEGQATDLQRTNLKASPPSGTVRQKDFDEIDARYEEGFLEALSHVKAPPFNFKKHGAKLAKILAENASSLRRKHYMFSSKFIQEQGFAKNQPAASNFCRALINAGVLYMARPYRRHVHPNIYGFGHLLDRVDCEVRNPGGDEYSSGQVYVNLVQDVRFGVERGLSDEDALALIKEKLARRRGGNDRSDREIKALIRRYRIKRKQARLVLEFETPSVGRTSVEVGTGN